MMRLYRNPSRAAGFSLVEMIMVIVITGIIAGIVAVFMSSPLQSYVDANRRADLTDAADLVLRRMSREIRQALPNSVRVTTSGGNYWIEFIATSGGGSYVPTSALYSTVGQFTLTVASTMPANPGIVQNDYIAINNTGSGYQNVYTCINQLHCNVMQVMGIAGQNLTVLPVSTNTAFESAPGSSRFQLIPGDVKAVSFSCPSAAFGQLRRYANYVPSSAQRTSDGADRVLVAENVRCHVSFPDTLQTFGVLVVTLTLQDRSGEESVTLMREIHIDNAL